LIRPWKNLSFEQMAAELNSTPNAGLQMRLSYQAAAIPPKPQTAEVAIADIITAPPCTSPFASPALRRSRLTLILP